MPPSVGLRERTKEKSRLSAGPSLYFPLSVSPELASLAGVLRLLARFRLAATLLLAGLLARVLRLLTRILVGVVHSGAPLLNLAENNPARGGLVAREHRFPEGFNVTAPVTTAAKEPLGKTTLYKPFG